MKICVISQYFPPDVGGASTRASNLVKSIEESGHEVVVVTAFPHYPHGVIPQKYRKKIMAVETLNRTRVIRVWVPPLPHQGNLFRFILYLCFAFSALFALPYCKGANVTWAISPNYLCMAPATSIKNITGSKVIHDVVDIWPEALMAAGVSLPKVILASIHWLSLASYVLSDRITTISRSMGASLRTNSPESVPISVIENCVDQSFFKPFPDSPSSSFRIMYLGTLGPANDFRTLLNAAISSRNRIPVRFIIAGAGEQFNEISRLIKLDKISNVDLLGGPIPHEDVPALLHQADALILPLKSGFGNTSLPSKLGEYLATGRPVICMADGEIARLVRENEIAMVVQPGSAEDLTATIESLSKDPALSEIWGRRGKKYAHDNLSFDAFSKKANKILENTAQNHRTKSIGAV